MLNSIVVTTPAKAFPAKQMNEVLMGIKNVVFQSVSARNYKVLKVISLEVQ